MKTFIALFMGSLLTFLFLEFGYTPPAPLQLSDKIKTLPEQLIASSFVEDADTTLKQRQNAIAILIKYDPNYFEEIDNAIDNKFSNQVVNKIADRKLHLLKNYSNEIVRAFDKEKYPALRERLVARYSVSEVGALKKKVLVERFREDTFIYMVLQKRYPGYSDEEIAEAILGSP